MTIDILDYQDKCPRCGASWRALEDDFNEPLHSIYYRQALLIVFNCITCKSKFQKILNGKGVK